ncbi:MAG: hypothetical protein K0Q57_373 [Gammaproteobacteria bacterium]|jgi:hypothetical protein|nr:hypothetical protein [Gammaproteobacteria bacterium]
MKNSKMWLISGLSLIIAQAAHAIVILPPGAQSNCDVTQQTNTNSPPAVLNEKAQLNAQLCNLKNAANAREQTIQQMQQALAANQSQIAALQQKISELKDNGNEVSFKWVKASSGNIPSQAFVGAENAGTKVYICQAKYNMNPGDLGAGNTYLYPGMLTANGCMITFAGKSFVQDHYKILTSKAAGYWGSPTQAGIQPNNYASVIGGYTSPAVKPVIGGYEPNQYVFICRAYINNAYYIGKVVSGNCNVASNGQEASWPNYQVLFTSQPTDSSSNS